MPEGQPMDNDPKVAVPSTAALCDVTATPADNTAGSVRVTVEPGITVQVTPSGEVEAVKVEPDRVTSR